MSEIRVKLFCVHLDQCDRKKCTALRLAKFDLVKIRPRLSACPNGALILDPFSDDILTEKDNLIAISKGLIVIDCSWAKIENSFQYSDFIGRRLPNAIAANPINYGKTAKLSSAEALAFALNILGLKNQAHKLLNLFSWGESFWNINQIDMNMK